MNIEIAAIRFAASNGVVFVEDADRTLSSEITQSGEPQAVDPSRSVTVDVVHAMDGNVSVTVEEGNEEPQALNRLFDGQLNVEYGRLRIRDVPGDNLITIGLTPGPTRVRIFTEAVDIPTSLLVLVPPV